MSESKFSSSCKFILEARLDHLKELAQKLPSWITVKELPGKGKIFKFAPHVTASAVTSQLLAGNIDKIRR
jgi:hypothetical protein